MTDDKHWQNIGVQVAYTNNQKRGNLIFHQQEESDLAHETRHKNKKSQY